MKYDENGKASNIGKTSEVILNQAIDNFDNIRNQEKLSFDIKDFDLSFVNRTILTPTDYIQCQD